MPTGIEFEQKFVLDLRQADKIAAELSVLALKRDHTITSIRQYYNKNGERCRSSQTLDAPKYVMETKKSIKIGTTYSICTEDEIEITKERFDEGWEKNPDRRLQKIRYIMPGRSSDHNVMVDFFYTKNPSYLLSNRNSYTYAIIAEDEIMLDSETQELYLRFQLPIYLERYLLTKVDDNDPEMKIFKSTNMVDQAENIDAVIRAISNFYEST